MATAPLARMSLEQYLALEETSETRHEFHDGEVYEMESATFRHQQIGTQFHGGVRPALKARGCEIHSQGTRVATSRKGLYTYPDYVIMCGQPKFWDTDPDTLSNPNVLVEILSPSTMDYNLGTKFRLYRDLTSLEEYVTIHQDEPLIEHHVRQPDGSWLIRDLQGIDATLRLASVGVEISLRTIYEGIEFDPR